MINPYGFLLSKPPYLENGEIMYKIATCHGWWRLSEDLKAIELCMIMNDKPGNGAFDYTIRWFERYAHVKKKKIRVIGLVSPRLKRHFIEKRGYTDIGNMRVEKIVC